MLYNSQKKMVSKPPLDPYLEFTRLHKSQYDYWYNPYSEIERLRQCSRDASLEEKKEVMRKSKCGLDIIESTLRISDYKYSWQYYKQKADMLESLLENTSIKFEYIKICELDDKEKVVTSISFPISPDRKMSKELKWTSPVSCDEAIKNVEAWFNEPLTEEYFNQLKDNLLYKRKWSHYNNGLYCRGSLLGGLRIINAVFLSKVPDHETMSMTMNITDF